MHIGDFDFYKDLLYKRSGLSLTSDKAYLLDSRLTPIAKKWEYPSLDAMTVALRAMANQDLIKDVVEAMTTNETSFFRDQRPFDTFKSVVLPYLLKTRAQRRTIRIWSAACSSGQEAYSLAMLLKEQESLIAGWRIEIVGTDISNEILDKARKGEFSQFEVQRGLPIQMLLKYFTQNGERWQINDNIKNMVRFNYFNLLDDTGSLGTFDVVFCRNVLIYFDEPIKKNVLGKISGQIQKDGFLFLGGAETVLGLDSAFKGMKEYRGLYALENGTYDTEALAQAVV
ncbi:MAG: protein-glutamate O-methyltransferase CheR [Rhodospirillales bacterium]|nr:protein-glutamate O-methyltransferase CheR [Rhodospirillales bacterium]